MSFEIAHPLVPTSLYIPTLDGRFFITIYVTLC